MKKTLNFIVSELACPHAVLSFIGLISVFALIAALTSEVVYGLEPCIMCIYQRIPFVLVALFTLIGLVLRKKEGVSIAMIGASGFAFLINSIVAFYHTGIEQKWWVSAVEGCKVPNFDTLKPQSMLENILSAPTARCDEIPWSDPILNLSMANYNIILCFGLFSLCVTCLFFNKTCKSNKIM